MRKPKSKRRMCREREPLRYVRRLACPCTLGALRGHRSTALPASGCKPTVAGMFCLSARPPGLGMRWALRRASRCLQSPFLGWPHNPQDHLLRGHSPCLCSPNEKSPSPRHSLGLPAPCHGHARRRALHATPLPRHPTCPFTRHAIVHTSIEAAPCLAYRHAGVLTRGPVNSCAGRPVAVGVGRAPQGVSRAILQPSARGPDPALSMVHATVRGNGGRPGTGKRRIAEAMLTKNKTLGALAVMHRV